MKDHILKKKMVPTKEDEVLTFHVFVKTSEFG